MKKYKWSAQKEAKFYREQQEQGDVRAIDIYDAEENIKEIGLRFGSQTEVDQFVRMITESQWWKRNFGLPIWSMPGNDSDGISWGQNFGDFGAVEISDGNRWELIVYHELAHTPIRKGGHTPRFVYNELKIVKHFNPYLGKLLEGELLKNGVYPKKYQNGSINFRKTK